MAVITAGVGTSTALAGSGAAAKSTATIVTNVALVASAAAATAGAVAASRAQARASEAAAVGAEFEADQLEQNAGQERAIAQRRALELRRRQRFAQSRLQAASAASGAGASDPTITGIDLDLEEEGLFRSSLALVEGNERANALQTGAVVRDFEAEQFRRAGGSQIQAGRIRGFSTVLGGFADAGLRNRFG